MKKVFILSALIASTIIFYNCHGPKKATASAAKVTFDGNLKAVIETNCTPCHIAGKGNKKSYDNYANVKSDIDDMIRRIELNPTDRGFMPFRKPTRLPEETIAVFKKWRDDGGLEK